MVMSKNKISIIDRVVKFFLGTKLLKNRLWILCYHSFCDRDNQLIPTTSLDVESLVHQLNLLRYYGFTFVSGSQVEDYFYKSIQLPEYSVLLTVDDGFKNYKTKMLPVLEKFQIPSVLFVTTDYVTCEKNYSFVDWTKNDVPYPPPETVDNEFVSLTLEDMICLGKNPLIEIGAHTCSHPFLTKIPLADAHQEILQSKKKLEEILQKEIKFFSYPHGDYSNKIISYVLKHFTLAFTVNRGSNGKYSIPHKLKRSSVKQKNNLTSLRKYILGVYDFIRLFDRLRGK